MKVTHLILDPTFYHQSVSVHTYICDCASIYIYTHFCSAYAPYINFINFCLKQYLVIELLTRCKYYSALSHTIYYNYISFFKCISVDLEVIITLVIICLVFFVSISIQPKTLQGKSKSLFSTLKKIAKSIIFIIFLVIFLRETFVSSQPDAPG